MPDPASLPGPKQAAAAVPAAPAPHFLTEEYLQKFWAENRTFVTLLCALLGLAVLARYGWQYNADRQEAAVRARSMPRQLPSRRSRNSQRTIPPTSWRTSRNCGSPTKPTPWAGSLRPGMNTGMSPYS